MSRIFINYRRQDSEGYVGRLYDHLAQHFQRDDLFMDVDSIPPGADFVQVLEDAVASCDVLIAVIGPGWLNCADDAGERRLHQWNDFVRIEIASALRQNKLVIPVLVGRARMPSPNDLPDELHPLCRRNAVELSHQHFSRDVEKLATAIKSAIPANPSFKGRANSETLRQKEAALKAVRDDLVGATSSPLYTYRIENRHFPVLGEGNPDANILFIGEAPGKNEAATGRPFIGPSGDVLAEMLRGIGLKRDDVYVTNVLLDFPGKRDPLPEELAFYAPFVDRIIDIIQPAVIATLGGFAMSYMLKKLDLPEKRGKISQLHGKLIKTRLPYGEIHVVPLYHPAVVLYSASQKETLRQDFEKLKLFL
ncbi:MAG: TIR domain-containing protein [Chloroflexi bacterium]|nr:TIR domain-containing protein [Chloroflexota bacterium]